MDKTRSDLGAGTPSGAGQGRSLAAGAARVAAGLALAALALLGGCAAYGPQALQPGATQAAARASMGEPSARHTRADGGTRWVYARGPEGRHTWMLDFGADGRLQRWHQALGEAAFERIAPGLAEAELLREFGPPAHRMVIARQGVEVWSWRYPTYECRWFRITLDARQRVVQEAGYAPDPACQVEEEDS